MQRESKFESDRWKRHAVICMVQYWVLLTDKLLFLREIYLVVGYLSDPREAAHRVVGDYEEGGQGAATSKSGAVVTPLFEG